MWLGGFQNKIGVHIFLDHTVHQNEGPLAVRNSSFLSSKEIFQVSSDMKIVKFNLTVEDIETILDGLVFEGKVEKSTTSDGNCNKKVKMYRSVAQPVPFASITKTPCGVCPVITFMCIF